MTTAMSLSTSPLPAGTGTPGRPRSAVVLPTTSPSPAKTGRNRPASLRQPLGVISVQAKSFQDRHRTEFAHLHTHSNDSLREKRLEAEKAELEYARRVGKEKRESLKAAADAAAAAASRGGKAGRRPLSLVVKQSTSSGSTPGGLRTPTSDSASRPTSAPPAGSAGLNAVIESSLSSAHLADDASPADTSISQSSYSWASQFSGETEELRTAARYVPKPRVHSDDSGEQEELNSEGDEDEEEEEILASPEDGTIRRRKKIVALAHTVRQLEGVGSREAEDPAFYATLVKAWNERPMVGAGVGGVPPSASSADGDGSSPYTPQTRYSDSAVTSTSNAGADGSSVHSRSVRYSYASTLHDLAVEGGGIEQANRIFLAKPWLRASIISTGAGGGTGTGESKKPVADFFGAGASQRPPVPAGDARRLSLASSPPPFGSAAAGGLLGSPIDLDSTDKHVDPRALRKVKGDVSSTAQAQGGAEDEHQDQDAQPQPQQQDAETSAPAPGSWGLGFVSDWFAGSAPVPAGAEHAEIPAAQSTLMPRSTTVAQFDDAPNDDSLLAANEDAEGESDPEYEYELAHEHLHEQGFHEGEDGASTGHPPPPPLLHVEVGPGLPHPQGTDAENEARPESSILPPSPLAEGAKDLDAEINKHLHLSSPTRPRPQKAAAADPDLSLSTTTTEAEAEAESITGSPSSNPSQPLICSTHSITSYQPRLVRLPSQLGLDPHPPVLVEELELLSSSEHSHSHEEDCSALSDSCSSPSTKTTTTAKRVSVSRTKPTLAPIQTTASPRTKTDNKSSDPRDIPLPSPDLDEQLTDPRFSNAYLLAQSIRVPTPSIRPATVRHSSANALNVLLSPTSRANSPLPSPGLLSPTSRTTSLSAYSPALPPPLSTPPTIEEMEISSRWLSQDSSDDDDMTLMMGGGGSTAVKPYQTIRTSPTDTTRPLPAQAQGQTRARSSTLSLTASPVQLSPMGPPPPSSTAMTAPLRKPSRPTLLDTRAPTLSSISELGSALGSALHPSDTLNSISGGSELLSDLEDGPVSPRLGAMSPDMATRRSRLAQSSLDSLPSQMRPPSISDSFASSSLGGRRGSSYQMYQQRQIERSRRANARVAAKMSGATAKELKQMEHEQHNPHLKGESGSVMVTPEPSRTACTLFFLGFVLGPWFWIFGGWMPLGHSGEIKRQNQEDEEAACSLDFTGGDHLPRGWRWTYHPDPWVKRNRRAAAIVIPILLVGGIAAAVAVAVVFGSA